MLSSLVKSLNVGQKWEIDVGCEFVGEPDFVQAVFEAVEGRGSDNYRRKLKGLAAW